MTPLDKIKKAKIDIMRHPRFCAPPASPCYTARTYGTEILCSAKTTQVKCSTNLQ